MIERRRELRLPTFKGAKIYIRGASAIDCVVRNFSSQGACLEVDHQHDIPENFDLVISKELSARPCRVVWRQGERIGVEFR